MRKNSPCPLEFIDVHYGTRVAFEGLGLRSKQVTEDGTVELELMLNEWRMVQVRTSWS